MRKDEIDRAVFKLKKIEIEDVLQGLTKICWKYNIQYHIIIKTHNTLIIKLRGTKETVVFKYHITNLVLRNEIEHFLNDLDVNKAQRGVYITTGEFEFRERFSIKKLLSKRDIILEDNFDFIKSQLGMSKKAYYSFNADKLKFHKYLPE